MSNFQNKKTQRNIFYSFPFLVFLAVILLFSIFGVVRFLIKMNETSKNRNIAENKVAELEKSKQKLTEDIESLKTDRGLEENIREKFGLAKEGEGLIVVVDDKNAEVPFPKPKGNWFTNLWNNWFK